MSEQTQAVRRFADEPYYHPHGGHWRVRRAKWGAAILELPFAAGRVLAEFERRSRDFNGGVPIPIVLDDVGGLGRRFAHTSRVRWISAGAGAGGKVLVVYVRSRSRSFTYTICHEVAHNLLYADGLTRLSAPPAATEDDVAVISQISTSTSHPLVVKTLESFDWPVVSHEATRAERFLKAASRGARSLTEPAVALIAAEFTVALGPFWLEGARSSLRRVSSFTEALARELLPLLEACVESVEAVESARRRIAERLLFKVEIEGVNPLVQVPGPGERGP